MPDTYFHQQDEFLARMISDYHIGNFPEVDSFQRYFDWKEGIIGLRDLPHYIKQISLVFPIIVNTFASNLNNLAMNELNRLKVVLVEKKKTGKWLAEQLGVSVTTTSRWCSNSSQPDLYTLNKIAELLNVSVFELIVNNNRSEQWQEK